LLLESAVDQPRYGAIVFAVIFVTAIILLLADNSIR
jgi:hypothetical protein